MQKLTRLSYSLIILMISSPVILAQTGLNESLGSANAQIGICGNMPFERKRRDCLSSTDLKQCLSLDSVNPQYISTPANKKSYLCINTSSTSGSRLIEEMVSSSQNACLSQNVQNFYRDIIEHPEFREISQQFEENLGTPLKLNFAIDTLNSVSSIQLDLQDTRMQEEDITLNVNPFTAQAPCQKFNPKSILKKVSEELARLTIKMSSKQNAFGNLAQKKSRRVFDASRFSENNAGDEHSFSANHRGTASKR